MAALAAPAHFNQPTTTARNCPFHEEEVAILLDADHQEIADHFAIDTVMTREALSLRSMRGMGGRPHRPRTAKRFVCAMGARIPSKTIALDDSCETAPLRNTGDVYPFSRCKHVDGQDVACRQRLLACVLKF